MGVGKTIVTIRRSFARSGPKVKEVNQASDGVLPTGIILLGINNFEGDILLDVTKKPAGILVKGTARIAEQVDDSGICKRKLRQVFDDIQKLEVTSSFIPHVA